ncbi:conjugal transfer protein TraO [Fibrella sp. WM1]|uniref:conjugal transfer protein TraO n=1 Tax=Fibrella musci TaxID=3242485 RepID=UPI00352058C0
MRRILFFLSLSFSSLLPALAQVHLKGQQFIEIQAGLTDDFRLIKNQLGINALISTGRYNRQYNAWKMTVSYVHKQHALADSGGNLTLRQFGVGWGYEFNLWRNTTRTRFVRGVVQPTVFYETVCNPQKTLSDTLQSSAGTSRFLLGGDVGLELEWSPILFSVRQRWLPKSTLQPFHTLLSIGWRFHQ